VKLADKGRTILISPEDISDIELICDKLMIMVDGKIAYLGPTISTEKMIRIIFQ
jgi:ABC-type multidrug transport system ATPase subunit